MAKQTTLDQILQAAMAVFGEKGFGEARVDEIAKRAGVNKATLYYHVGDKDALYATVMEAGLRRVAEAVFQAVEVAEGPEAKLRAFVQGVAKGATQHEYAASIMMREVASGGRHLPDAALAYMGRVVRLLREILEQGVGQGLFRRENPFVIHMLIIGSLQFYICNAPIRARIAKQNRSEFAPNNFVTLEEVVRIVGDFVVASLRHPSPVEHQ